MDPELLKKVEAVLFASGRFVDASRIAELLDASQRTVEKALELLRKTYAESESVLRIIEEDAAWKLHVDDQYLELVSKIVSSTEISGPVLETLAVIAWRSPAIQSEVVDIRGSNAYEHIKELVESGYLVKESFGRSYKLRVTDKFFEYFDIEGREDIRKMFKDVEEEHRKKEMEVELQQKRLHEALRKAEGLDKEDIGQAIRKVEQGGVAEVSVPQKTLTEVQDRKISIDDLDEMLERSQKKREALAKNLEEMRPKEEETQEESESLEEAQELPLEDAAEELSEQQTETPLQEEPEEKQEEDASDDYVVVEEKPEEQESTGDPELDKIIEIRKQVEKDIKDISQN